MPKPIIFVAQRVPYPPNKGEKIRTYYQIKHLVALHERVVVVCPIENSDEAQYAKDLAKSLNIEVLVHQPRTPKLIRYAFGLLKGEPLSVSNFYSKALCKLLVQKASQDTPKSIVFTASSLHPYALALQNNGIETQLFFDFMDLDSDKWQQYASKASFLKRVLFMREYRTLAKVEKSAANMSDKTFFISSNEVALFKQQQGNKFENVMAVGNGIDQEAFFPVERTFKHDKLAFLFVGVMDYKPNIEAAMTFATEYMPKILAVYPHAKFTIVGMHPSDNIKNLQKTGYVDVTGFVDSVKPYFDSHDIFVAPFSLARGVQNKVLQSMACGLPVITTSLGAEGIACIDKQHVCLAENTTEFMAVLTQLIEDKAFRTSISEQSVDLINRQYSWQSCLSEFERWVV